MTTMPAVPASPKPSARPKRDSIPVASVLRLKAIRVPDWLGGGERNGVELGPEVLLEHPRSSRIESFVDGLVREAG